MDNQINNSIRGAALSIGVDERELMDFLPLIRDLKYREVIEQEKVIQQLKEAYAHEQENVQIMRQHLQNESKRIINLHDVVAELQARNGELSRKLAIYEKTNE